MFSTLHQPSSRTCRIACYAPHVKPRNNLALGCRARPTGQYREEITRAPHYTARPSPRAQKMEAGKAFKNGYGTFSGFFSRGKTAAAASTDPVRSTSSSAQDDAAQSSSGAQDSSSQEIGPPKEPSATRKSLSKKAWAFIIIMSALVILAVGLLAGLLTRGGHAQAASGPNIVFIMTDDQDKRLGSLDYMPVVQRELVGKGTEFSNHYTTQALCCPSRSSLLRGQQVHNTNITNVVKPG